MARGALSVAALSLVLALGIAAPPARAEREVRRTALAAEIDALREQLRQHPRDVDIQLRLAFRLAWTDHRTEARALALEVLRRAPGYWDAHLLVARIDAWNGDHDAARARVKAVLAARPRWLEALSLAADIGLWSHHYIDAERAARAMIAIEPTADAYYRLAQIAHARMRLVDALELTGEALALDPDHAPSRRLRDDIALIRVIAGSSVDIFPIAQPEFRYGFSQSLAVSVFPRGRWSVSASYEYDHRFATDNHRIGLLADWRATDQLTLSAFARTGWVEVVPERTVFVSAVQELDPRFAAGVRYTYDGMKWPGQLHRFHLTSHAQVYDQLALGAELAAGALRHCGRSDFVQSVLVSGLYSRGRTSVGIRYAYGVEVERPPLPVYLEGRFGDDVCAADVEEGVTEVITTRAHDVAAHAALTINRHLALRAGYGIQLRFSGEEVHMFHLVLRGEI